MDHQSSPKSENEVSSKLMESEKLHQPGYEIIDEEVHLTSIYSENFDEKSQSALQTCERNNEEEIRVKEMESEGVDNVISEETAGEAEEGNLDIEESGRERLERHRVEMAGRVWIPDLWGQEEFLKDWIDCAAFDAPLVASRIMTARAALVEEGRRTNSAGLRVQNSC